MRSLIFYPLIPLLFLTELCMLSLGSPHLVLLAFATSLICDPPSIIRRTYVLLFGAASALIHAMALPYTVAAMCTALLLWHFVQHVFTRDWLIKSLVVATLLLSLLWLGGGFSWTLPILIANIIIVPVMVWVWCEV
ncbi:MAG: hypothetical protein M1549_03315 [Candidatus Dependentiae bacterium]|nr:hypothetical protein [Candidatus Dependentiae bacterium]